MTRILLINFTEKEVKKISENLPLKFDRGYLSDIIEPSKREIICSSHTEEDEDYVNNIDFYIPHPVYEYEATFINLNSSENIDDEFKEKVKKLSKKDKQNFFKYWFLKGKPLTVFLGDYNYRNLTDIGVVDFQLHKVQDNDITIIDQSENNRKEVCNNIHKHKKSVIIPTENYIRLEEKAFFTSERSGYKIKNIIWNNNNEDIGLFVDFNGGYSPSDRPRIILLPQFRQNIDVVEDLTKMLANLYPKNFIELPNLDWINSEKFYPVSIGEYDSKIEKLILEAKNQIDELKSKKEESKSKYKELRELLYQKGDDLKKAVIAVLENYFKLKVIDSDENLGDALADEDIVVIDKNNHLEERIERKILFEVKGDGKQYPSPIHIGQVWKHLSRSSEKNIKEGGLILNYDIQTEPKERQLAYSGDDEKELNDIIFIDTRVLFKLALAIIEDRITPEKATGILLKKGRVEYGP